MTSLLGKLAYAWGVLGFLAFIANGLWRLTPIAWEPIAAGELRWHHWLLLAGWCGFMLYTKAYRGFHRAFAPRFAARAVALARHPTPLDVILAPAFCMGLIHATRKRLIISWLVVAAIGLLVVGMRMLDQPWRGMVDAGVVLGLAAGSLSVMWYAWRGLEGATLPVDPDLSGA